MLSKINTCCPQKKQPPYKRAPQYLVLKYPADVVSNGSELPIALHFGEVQKKNHQTLRR